MEYLLILLSIIFAYLIFTRKENRFSWLYIALIFSPGVINIVKKPTYVTDHDLYLLVVLYITFFLSNLRKEWKQYPLKTITILLLINNICITATSLTPLKIQHLIWYGAFEFIGSFLLVFLSFSMIKDNKPFDFLYKKMPIITFLFTFITIFSYITKTNPYMDLVLSFSNIEYVWSNLNNMRGFRITGFHMSPNSAGLIYTLLSIFILGYTKRLSTKDFILTICLLFCTFMTATRAAIICHVFALLLIYLLKFNLSKKIKIAFYVIISFIVIQPLLPNKLTNQLNDLTSAVTDIFITGGEESTGSSVELREIQTTSALYYFTQHPYWGHGFNYHDVVHSGEEGSRDDLYGLEGYHLKLLVEEGGIQIVLVLFFLTLLFSKILKNSKKMKDNYSIMMFTILTTYIIFLISSRPGDTWHYVMPMLGALLKIKIINFNKNETYIIYNR